MAPWSTSTSTSDLPCCHPKCVEVTATRRLKTWSGATTGVVRGQGWKPPRAPSRESEAGPSRDEGGGESDDESRGSALSRPRQVGAEESASGESARGGVADQAGVPQWSAAGADEVADPSDAIAGGQDGGPQQRRDVGRGQRG